MFTAKVGEKSKNLTFKVAVAIFTFLLVAILGPGLLNLDSSQALAKKKNRGGCNKIAKNVRVACGAEVIDDYYIAIGNCNNISDRGDRAECIREARAERRDAKEECADQFEARRDLCEALGEIYYEPDIDSLTFIAPANITSGPSGNANPYFPLVPGNMWTYKTKEGGVVTETITVEVLDGESINILGVDCVVVRDIVYDGDDPLTGDIIEDTYDWYGQQDDGTVWYMGEFSLAKEDCEPEELCEGLYTEDGSWKSGFEGGKPGIIMFGDPEPEVGTVFRQEVALGDAEDAGEVLSFGVESVTVPAGTFATDVVETLDFTPIEPDETENKYYAPGVGVILEVGFEDGIATERVELESINFTP